MSKSFPFKDLSPSISGNAKLRAPQTEAFEALTAFAKTPQREAGIVLPVGCGKSGTITLTPFAFRSRRTLVVSPGVAIANQLVADFDPSTPRCFYRKCAVLGSSGFPEPVELRGNTCNRSDLDSADVVITNIQQLEGNENRWLNTLPQDYFDLIVFDEGHHSVAQTYGLLKARFPTARIVNFSATPRRADGQLMPGQVVYSYPIARAIGAGYVKKLTARRLNPATLKYVRREGAEEIEVALPEVIRLGEVDADFRKSIVTSKQTLDTIVDVSIEELDRLREASSEPRLKIIASALNHEHCIQIVKAYTERGRRAAFVHTRVDSKINERVLKKLETHDLDVIVQVRKLSEGFDHPYLAVAAVFSIFSNLAPFVQFVGRIMRVVKQDSPGDAVNNGTVVFHAGANIAKRWDDFREFSQADQLYFDELLPMTEVTLGEAAEPASTPQVRPPNTLEITGQQGVMVESVPLVNNPEALEAIQKLQALGYSANDVVAAWPLQEQPRTKQNTRQAAKAALDQRVATEAGQLLHRHNMNPKGLALDKAHRGKENFAVVKSSIDRQINALVGKASKQRHEFTQSEFDQINAAFPELVKAAEREVFHA